MIKNLTVENWTLFIPNGKIILRKADGKMFDAIKLGEKSNGKTFFRKKNLLQESDNKKICHIFPKKKQFFHDLVT